MGERVVEVSFDIFKINKEGPVWRGAAITLDEAKKRVRELAKVEPGEYMIFNQQTGERLQITPGKTEPTEGGGEVGQTK